MRKILFFTAIIFAAMSSKAQAPIQVSQPYSFLQWIKVKDSVRGAIFLQGSDTLATMAFARGFAGAGTGYGIKKVGGNLTLDTAVARKMDSAYAVNDSTVGFKINGHLYTFLIRGRYSPGTPCTGCLLASNNFSDIGNTSTARTNLGLGTAATKDAPASGNASTIQVVLGSDTRLGSGLTYPFTTFNYLNGFGNFAFLSTDSVLEDAGHQYFHPADTANHWASSIYRKPGSDSVFYIKGGVAIFAFRDSTSSGGGMTNPMTTAGDFIYGGSSGTPLRLPAGTGTQVLHSGTTPGWALVGLTTDVTGALPDGNIASATTWNGKQAAISFPNTVKKYYNGYGAFPALNSDSTTEGSTNLYFTNARARSSISVTAPLAYNSSTGVISDTSSGGGGGGSLAPRYNIVTDGGADPTGATDIGAIVNAAIASGKRIIYFPGQSKFKVTTAIIKHDSVYFIGDGRNTSIIELTSNIVAVRLGNYSGWQGIGFEGNYAGHNGGSATTGQVCIELDTVVGTSVKDYRGFWIGGSTVVIKGNGTLLTNFMWTNTVEGGHVETCGDAGIKLDVRAEYNIVNDNDIADCSMGILVAGGNNIISNNHFTGDAYGIQLIGGSNHGHGMVTSNTFNHSGAAGLYANGCSLGMSLVNNHFYSDSIVILNSSGIKIDGGDIDAPGIRIFNSTNIHFSFVDFKSTPVWLVSGGSTGTVLTHTPTGTALMNINYPTIFNETSYTSTEAFYGGNAGGPTGSITEHQFYGTLLGAGAANDGQHSVSIVNLDLRIPSGNAINDPAQIYAQNSTGSAFAIFNNSRYGPRVMPNMKTVFGGATPDASALVDMQTTTEGFLPPRMTLAQFTAISSKATSLHVALTDSSGRLALWNGTKIVTYATTDQLGGGSGGTTYTMGAIDSLTKSQNGAVIAGSKLVLQHADSTYPGLPDTAVYRFLLGLFHSPGLKYINVGTAGIHAGYAHGDSLFHKNLVGEPAGGIDITTLADSSAFFKSPIRELGDYISDFGNTSTTETNAMNYIISPTVQGLNNDGEKFYFDIQGTFLDNASANRTVRAYFAGTLIFTSGALTTVTQIPWRLTGWIIRASSSTARCSATLTYDGGSAKNAYTALTGLDFTSNNIFLTTLQAGGTGAATNDIVERLGTFEWKKANVIPL